MGFGNLLPKEIGTENVFLTQELGHELGGGGPWGDQGVRNRGQPFAALRWERLSKDFANPLLEEIGGENVLEDENATTSKTAS